MQYGMEDFWYGMEMEWKKIASMDYGKIVFHSIPFHTMPWLVPGKRTCFRNGISEYAISRSAVQPIVSMLHIVLDNVIRVLNTVEFG